jgi:hypothetical protein
MLALVLSDLPLSLVTSAAEVDQSSSSVFPGPFCRSLAADVAP